MAEAWDENMDVQEEEEGDDDEYVPHPYGSEEARCHKYHFKDEVTDAECVRMIMRCECEVCQEADARGEEIGRVDEPGHKGYYEEVRSLVAGEGVAIGKNPCEFHRNLAEWGWI